ncbi:MAG: M81 family metallopeptidase [Anaerolineae bacterium]|nr:M81 family metallopeptidase [Anaerolineae bacterium]
MLKIVIAGIATESCTFSTLPTRLADFNIVHGDDTLFWERYPFLSDYADVEFVGTVVAKAMPGGSVEAAAYDVIKQDMLKLLREKGAFDGVYLDMHGAMNVQGRDDAEGDWYTAIREVVGDDCLISASYDLHGNVSERIMQTLDLMTGYRTAPHVDVIETRLRAVALLIRCLREDIRPKKAFVKIPVALPGEKTSTEWEPGSEIYAQILAKIDGEQVMDATIQIGYVWADEPRMTACAIAIGLDDDAIQEAAIDLAETYWSRRADFEFGVPAMSVTDCIRQAMKDSVSPVLISDSGDNPTAGGVGDVTVFLQESLELKPDNMVYASIPDAIAVEMCIDAGLGASVTLEIGGKLDKKHSQPLSVSGIVQFILDKPHNRQVVMKSDGILIIITEQRTPFHHRQQFVDLNIIPEEQHIIVVKIGYLVPELKAMAKKAYLALSAGAVNQDIVRLPYQRIHRPCYPFDSDMIWTPQVQVF